MVDVWTAGHVADVAKVDLFLERLERILLDAEMDLDRKWDKSGLHSYMWDEDHCDAINAIHTVIGGLGELCQDVQHAGKEFTAALAAGGVEITPQSGSDCSRDHWFK